MMTSVTRMGMNSGWLRTVCISVSPEQRSLRKLQERLWVEPDAERRHAGQRQREAQAETAGVEPDAERRHAGQRQREAQAETAGEGRRLFVGLAIKHAAQIGRASCRERVA